MKRIMGAQMHISGCQECVAFSCSKWQSQTAAPSLQFQNPCLSNVMFKSHYECVFAVSEQGHAHVGFNVFLMADVFGTHVHPQTHTCAPVGRL